MYLTLIRKELLLNILSLRYAVTFLLFISLILVSTALRTHLYNKQVKDYQSATSERMKSMEEVRFHWQSKGLGLTVEKPPNPLSIFALGLENEMVRSFSLSDWFPPSTGPRKLNNPSFRYFLKVDFVLILNIVCSLLALLLVYDAICGERERGTLKVLLSGPLPRDSLILSKLVAGFLTLMIPLVLAVILSLLYVTIVGGVAFSLGQMEQLFAIFGLSALYVTFFFALGLAISTFTQNGATALVWCLFAWVVLVLGLPNLVPMVVKHFSPVPPQAKILMEKEAIRSYVELELQPVWRQEMGESGLYPELSEMLRVLRERMGEEIQKREEKIDQFYNSRIQRQVLLGQQFSRLSPSAGYVYATTQFAGTGVHDFLKLLRAVQVFQKEFLEKRDELEEKRKQEEKAKKAALKKGEKLHDAFDPRAWPPFRVPQADLRGALHYSLVDIAILAAMSTLLFLISFLGFLRYDAK